MNQLFVPALLVCSLGLAGADDFHTKFEALKKGGDDAAIQEFLEKASADEAGNPDYYAAAGNYWWSLAEAVTISRVKEGNFELDPDDFSIRDPKTGKKVGRLGKAGKVNPELPKRALKILSEGARRFPERADIALGLTHVQKEMGFTEAYVGTLIALLAEAKKDSDVLTWTKGGALPKPAASFLPETVQTYTAALFNANSPATDALCGKLLAAVTDAFPDHPYAYNLQAALADATGKPEEALKFLETAHQKAPGDHLILMNLGDTYAKQGQKEKAEASYRKVLKLGSDPRTQRKAEAALEKLRNAAADSPGAKAAPESD